MFSRRQVINLIVSRLLFTPIPAEYRQFFFTGFFQKYYMRKTRLPSDNVYTTFKIIPVFLASLSDYCICKKSYLKYKIFENTNVWII